MIVQGYLWAWLVVWTLTGRPVGHELGPRFDTYEDCEMARMLLAPQAKYLNVATLEVCRPVPNPKTWAPLTVPGVPEHSRRFLPPVR